ncbi:MAG TPA: flagellin [Burkholderiaceae bacterium]|jgi:flagellin|nr:flagellin [Burkholderiaceae bacterium]
MLTINTNVASLNAQRNLSTSQNALALSIQRLSTGLRVNSAKDDAAGLAIAERMNAQIRGMNVAIRNANDGVSMAQIAEGAMTKVGDMLQRMRELAVQSANGTITDADRTNLDAEFQQLGDEIVRVLGAAKFNNKAILGADAGATTFQVGAGASDTLSATLTRMDNHASITPVTGTGSVTTAANATSMITAIDTALDLVNTERSKLGALQSRFEAVVSALQIASENQAAARSRIIDADFASETAALTRAQILQQAGTAMLAQANASPQVVLALLRG